jgi:hypothetical protein
MSIKAEEHGYGRGLDAATLAVPNAFEFDPSL